MCETPVNVGQPIINSGVLEKVFKVHACAGRF
jgi:hypothetical protein